MSVFEIIMLICFGASWPLSIYRTWRVKSSHGKSLMFLTMIAVGYMSGTIHKLLNDPDPVTLLYIMNGLMVSTDIALSAYYRRKPQSV
jgi:hypothetical protein